MKRGKGVLVGAALLVFGCGSQTGSANGDATGVDVAGAETVDPEAVEDGTGDATVVLPEFRVRILTHTHDEGIPDASTGDFFVPSISNPGIDVDPKYTHVLSFQLTPWAFPLRAPESTNGPVVLFSDDFDTLVFSPMDHFFHSLVNVKDGQLQYGVQGEVESIPPGFRHRFLLVEGKGIGATIMEWGRLLQEDRNIQPRDRYADTGVGYLGYWTDNGAAYFYKTEPEMNYEDTLLAVKADGDERGIPYGYFQLDSWWYQRGPDGIRKGGIYLFEPMEGIFHQGVAEFQQRLGLPLITHSKWFEKENGYLGRYEFSPGDERWVVPLTGGVYDEMLANAAAWGIITYEPDWILSHMLWEIPWLRQDIHRMSDWMKHQSDASQKHGLSMQLCMAGAASIMDTVDRPPALTFRTSIDYHRGVSKESFWPMFHTVNMLTSALGIWPFKDNFYSSEPYGEQEALVSVMSGGMVGVGDPLGQAVPEILQRTCRADGVLLKPDRSAIPVDAMFLPHQRPYTVYTSSTVAGLGTWYYVSAFHLARNHPDRGPIDEAFAALTYDERDLNEMFVWPDEVTDWTLDLEGDLGITERVVVYDWRTRTITEAQGTYEMEPAPGLYDWRHLVIAPILDNGLVLIGETDKYVTVADKRFASVETEGDEIVMDLSGAPHESFQILCHQVGRATRTSGGKLGSDGKRKHRCSGTGR